MRYFDYRGVVVTIDDESKKPYTVNVNGIEFKTKARRYVTRFIDERLNGNKLPKQDDEATQGRRRNRA